jgi:hypothetical protein
MDGLSQTASAVGRARDSSDARPRGVRSWPGGRRSAPGQATAPPSLRRQRTRTQRFSTSSCCSNICRSVGRQESEHVAFLIKRLGGRARPRPRPDFGDALSAPERFLAAAIDLEELTIAAYIGQGANLTRDTLGAVGTLLSVEARQVAWLLDLAGDSPAPRAADPARKPDDVLRELRKRRFLP